jgi:hypothetical protein
MISINRNPSARELRRFAAIWLPAFAAGAGTVALRRWGAPRIAVGIWAAGSLTSIGSLLKPSLARTVFLALSYITYPVGLCLSYGMLALVYFLVVTPLGLAMKLAGRDALRLRRQHDAESYWSRIARTDEDVENYFRQF